MKEKIRILVAGCGAMGRSHSLAYSRLEEFEIVGARQPQSGKPGRLSPGN